MVSSSVARVLSLPVASAAPAVEPLQSRELASDVWGAAAMIAQVQGYPGIFGILKQNIW